MAVHFARQRVQERGRWPALDGLRAVAVAGVILYHVGLSKVVVGGYLGVDMFFVLSGFLITSLLWRELDATGRINLRAFYARRALRLFPALAAVIAVSLALAAVIAALRPASDIPNATVEGLPWVMFYVGNWAKALSVGNLGLLSHAWSLAVEEQFYLVWPPVLLLLVRGLRRPAAAAVVLSVATAGEMVYREWAFRAGWSLARIANGTDTHSDGLLFGSALACWALAAGGETRLRARVVPWGAAAVLGALMVAVSPTPSRLQFAYPLAVLAGGALVWCLTGGPIPVMTRVLTWPPVRWTGERSYGLYLWHFPILMAARALEPQTSLGRSAVGL